MSGYVSGFSRFPRAGQGIIYNDNKNTLTDLLLVLVVIILCKLWIVMQKLTSPVLLL